jgi:hypothetical protein
MPAAKLATTEKKRRARNTYRFHPQSLVQNPLTISPGGIEEVEEIVENMGDADAELSLKAADGSIRQRQFFQTVPF